VLGTPSSTVLVPGTLDSDYRDQGPLTGMHNSFSMALLIDIDSCTSPHTDLL
jgi:hypothetical protein